MKNTRKDGLCVRLCTHPRIRRLYKQVKRLFRRRNVMTFFQQYVKHTCFSFQLTSNGTVFDEIRHFYSRETRGTINSFLQTKHNSEIKLIQQSSVSHANNPRPRLRRLTPSIRSAILNETFSTSVTCKTRTSINNDNKHVCIRSLYNPHNCKVEHRCRSCKQFNTKA